MLLGTSRSAGLFVFLVLFISLSIFLLPSHSSGSIIRHVYQRQLSVTTRFTFTTATLIDTIIISTVSPDQPTSLPQSSSMRSFSVSFRPTVSASSRSSSSSIFSTRSSSFSSQNREPTSLTSRPSPAFSKTTLTFIQPSIPVSTRPTPVALSASDRKATSILPVITPPASSNQDVPPPSFTAAPAGAVNLGFWSNKAAVAGTFTGVGLVAIGIIAILLMACIKKRRNKQPEEDIHRSFLPISSPYDWPPTRARAPGRGRRLMDPFAAGDSVPIRRPFAAASNPGRHGRVYSEEDSLSISDNHTSSGNGYVNYDYSATSSDSWPSLIRTRSAPLHQSLGSPTSTSSLRTGLDLPPAHDPVVPESPISMGALSSVPSLYLDSEQIGRRSRHQVSGASFYADQLHSYYYGENDEPPHPQDRSERLFDLIDLVGRLV